MLTNPSTPLTFEVEIPSTTRRDTGGDLDWNAIDFWVFSIFTDKALLGQVRKLEKVELTRVWSLTERAIKRHRRMHHGALDPLEVHRRLLEGIAGESLLLSSSMFLDSMAEVEDYFDLTFKTIKSKLGKSLDPGTGERAIRAARVATVAAEVLGSFELARKYMHTKNFALGGATPAELLKTSEGERIVLNELQSQAEGGPL